jgi:hypothetical protein
VGCDVQQKFIFQKWQQIDETRWICEAGKAGKNSGHRGGDAEPHTIYQNSPAKKFTLGADEERNEASLPQQVSYT